MPWLLTLIFACTVVDVLSVGMVVPLLATINDPSWFDRQPSLASVAQRVGATTDSSRIILVTLALVGVQLLKSTLTVLAAFWETKAVYSTQADLSAAVYRSYLSKPWPFFLQSNSAVLTRTATIEPSHVAGLLLAILRLGAEVLVLLALVAVLVIVEPVGAMAAAGLVAIASISFNVVTRRRVAAWGRRRLEADNQRYFGVQQVLSGVKECLLLGIKEHLVARFSVANQLSAHCVQRQQFLSQLPRVWLELAAVCGLAALVFLMVLRQDSIAISLPIIGLFAAAAFRLLPAAARILGHLQTIRFSLPALRAVHDALASVQVASQSDEVRGPDLAPGLIRLNLVRYRYPGAPTDVLCDVSLSVEPGSAIAVLGPSGSGKSTLIDVIMGLLPATSGSITVGGTSIYANLRGWQRLIGYVPQAIFLLDDTIRRNVAFGVPDSEISDAAVWSALRGARLEEFVRGLPGQLDTSTGERGVCLSGGQRQRIGIARALYINPAVLVLDEATSALDERTEEEFVQAVMSIRGAKTVIFVTHRTSVAAKCDRVCQLVNGSLLPSAQP